MAAGRYSVVLQTLARRGEGAFVPFTVLGDPDPDTSLAILDELVANGADLLEVGIPFSDPVADGPAIQGADLRALKAGVTPAVALDILAAFRRRHAELPIGLLIYTNLVRRPGLETFYRRLARAGADSVLLADLPLEEAAPFRAAAEAAGIAPVFIATPLTPAHRLTRLLDLPSPFLYVVSRAGVTGSDADLAATAGPLLRRIRAQSGMPTLLGFGISRPLHVRQALAAGATGAICGSAIVEIVARHAPAAGGGLSATQRQDLRRELGAFVRNMKAATLPR